MTEQYEGYPVGLRGAARQVQEVADHVGGLAGRRGEWSGTEVFGGDSFGLAVGSLFARWVEPLAERLESVPGLLTDHAAGYRAMADNNEVTEAELTERTRRLDPQARNDGRDI